MHGVEREKAHEKSRTDSCSLFDMFRASFFALSPTIGAGLCHKKGNGGGEPTGWLQQNHTFVRKMEKEQRPCRMMQPLWPVTPSTSISKARMAPIGATEHSQATAAFCTNCSGIWVDNRRMPNLCIAGSGTCRTTDTARRASTFGCQRSTGISAGAVDTICSCITAGQRPRRPLN